MKSIIKKMLSIFVIVLAIVAGQAFLQSKDAKAAVGDSHVLVKSPGPYVLDNGQVIYCVDAFLGTPAKGTNMIETDFPANGMMTSTNLMMTPEHVTALEQLMALQYPSLTEIQMQKLFPSLPAIYNTDDKGSVELSNAYVQQMNLWIWQYNTISRSNIDLEYAISVFANAYDLVVDIRTEDWTNYFKQMDSYYTDIMNGRDLLDVDISVNSDDAKLQSFGSDNVMGPYVIKASGSGVINDIVPFVLDNSNVKYVDENNQEIPAGQELYNGDKFYVVLPQGSDSVTFGLNATVPTKTDMTFYIPEGFQIPTTWKEWSDLYKNDKSIQPMASFSKNQRTISIVETTKSTKVVLEAKKVVEGATLQDKQFKFEVQDSDNNNAVVATGTNDASGIINFTSIYYDKQAVGTHHYQVVEVQQNTTGWINDTKAYLVNVEVVANSDGSLSATATYPDGAIAFTNTFSPPEEPDEPDEPESPTPNPEEPDEPETPTPNPEKPAPEESVIVSLPKAESPKTNSVLPITGDKQVFFLVVAGSAVIGAALHIGGFRRLNRKR